MPQTVPFLGYAQQYTSATLTCDVDFQDGSGNLATVSSFSGGLYQAGTSTQYTTGVTISLTPLATGVYGLSVSVTGSGTHVPAGNYSIRATAGTIGSGGNQIALVGNSQPFGVTIASFTVTTSGMMEVDALDVGGASAIGVLPSNYAPGTPGGLPILDSNSHAPETPNTYQSLPVPYFMPDSFTVSGAVCQGTFVPAGFYSTSGTPYTFFRNGENWVCWTTNGSNWYISAALGSTTNAWVYAYSGSNPQVLVPYGMTFTGQGSYNGTTAVASSALANSVQIASNPAPVPVKLNGNYVTPTDAGVLAGNGFWAGQIVVTQGTNSYTLEICGTSASYPVWAGTSGAALSTSNGTLWGFQLPSGETWTAPIGETESSPPDTFPWDSGITWTHYSGPNSGTPSVSVASGGGSSGDPLAKTVPGSYTAGQAGYALGTILSRVSTTPIQTIVLVQPGGAITLEQYASYRAERGNPLPVPNPGGWPDLTGADVHLWIAQQQAGTAIMPPVIDISGGAVQGAPSAATGVNFDIPSSDTAELTLFTQNAYAYCLVAYYSSNGDQVPLTDWANCTVRPGKALTS